MNLEYVFNKIEKYKRNSEEFINLKQLNNVIKNIDNLILSPGILTPYYIDNNKIYEFYWYELYLEDENIEFEKWLENKVQKSISEMSQEFISHNKNCFLPIKNIENGSMQLIKYMKYVRNSKEIEEIVISEFGRYDYSKLYIALYI